MEDPLDRSAAHTPETPIDVKANISQLPKIISFSSLCRCGDEVWIENEGSLYRLRRTRQGKLLLTK